MGDIVKRRCCHCGKIYEYEVTANFIAFCPRCKRFDCLDFCYTDNVVAPCRIYLGDEFIGEINADNDNNYALIVPSYSISEKLANYDNPLYEAAKIVGKALGEVYGSMDYRNGKLILSNEAFGYGYTYKQFRKSALYTGQNSIRAFTLNGTHKIDNRIFYVTFTFRQGYLYMISLCCEDSGICFEEEQKRKVLHDGILAEYGLFDYEHFEWGSISSVYDARSNTSSINIVFEYDTDELNMLDNREIIHDIVKKDYSKNSKSATVSVMNVIESTTKVADLNDCYESERVMGSKNEPLKEYLMRLLNENDSKYYSCLDAEPNTLYTFRKELLTFRKRLNYQNAQDKETEQLFLFLHNNDLTISKLVAKKQGKEYLFSQLKYALELEDTYYRNYLLPLYENNVLENYAPDEIPTALHNFKKINGLTGYVADLEMFVNYFLKQWKQFVEYLFKTINQVCNNICVKVSFSEAVRTEIAFLTSHRKNFFKDYDSDMYYDGTNDNPYKNLYIYCLISYLDDFYLSTFPDISQKTFLEDYYLSADSDINEGLYLNDYQLKDIPDFSGKDFPNVTLLRNVVSKKVYTLKDVAEVYAEFLNADSRKVYKRLEKYFSCTGIFKPSSESGEYEFDDVILPIAAHMYYKIKNRKYDSENKELLSDNQVFEHIYYPLFKAKVFGHDEIVEAYSQYRTFIINEFKEVIKSVNDDYLTTFINDVVGKSAMRLSMCIMGISEDLIDSI